MDLKPAIIDIGSVTTIDMGVSDMDPHMAEDELKFQDYSKMSKEANKYPSRVGGFGQGGEEIFQSENDILISGDDPDGKPVPPSAPWGFSLFAQYFGVTTEDVLSRITWSMMPLKAPTGESYIERFIRNNPDVYGPFWISVTLIFSIAIFSNLSSYLITDEREQTWHNNWQIIISVSTIVLSYISIIPLILWSAFWFRGCTNTFTLLELTCAYGYSLSIFIPITLLWTINIHNFRFILVIVCSLLSGTVLARSLEPIVKSDPSKTFKSSYIMLFFVLASHSFVGILFLIQYEKILKTDHH